MWPDPQETADLVTFTEEIFNVKLHFLCSEGNSSGPNTISKLIWYNLLRYEDCKNNLEL